MQVVDNIPSKENQMSKARVRREERREDPKKSLDQAIRGS